MLKVKSDLNHDVIRDFVGEVNCADEFGHRVKNRFIQTTAVGERMIDGELCGTHRVDVWCDWFIRFDQYAPSARIRKSWYVGYSEKTLAVTDLSTNSVDLDAMREESYQKRLKELS